MERINLLPKSNCGWLLKMAKALQNNLAGCLPQTFVKYSGLKWLQSYYKVPYFTTSMYIPLGRSGRAPDALL